MKFNFRIPLNAPQHKSIIIDIIKELKYLPKYEFIDDLENTNIKLVFESEEYKNEFLQKLIDSKINFGGSF